MWVLMTNYWCASFGISLLTPCFQTPRVSLGLSKAAPLTDLGSSFSVFGRWNMCMCSVISILEAALYISLTGIKYFINVSILQMLNFLFAYSHFICQKLRT